VTLVGLKAAVTPAGRPEIERAMLSALPDTRAVPMLLVPAAPCTTETLPGLALIEKSLDGGEPAVTVSFTVTLCVADGEVPVTVKEYVAARTDAPAEMVRVELPPVVTEAGLKDAVTPDGSPLALSAIASGLPEISAVPIVVWTEAPVTTLREDGFVGIEKLFGGGGADVGRPTEPKVAVLSALVLCEVTAIPARTVPETPRTSLEPAIGVQLTPSDDVYAVTMLPDRSTDTYAGTVPGMFEMVTTFALAHGRCSTKRPAPGVTSKA
jgi:hypothetical protein